MTARPTPPDLLSSEQQVRSLARDDNHPTRTFSNCVKLTDLYDMDGFHHVVNTRSPAFVRDDLVA